MPVIGSPQLVKVLDPRSPLGRMRRREVYAFAQAFNVPFTPGEATESVRQRLLQAGYSGAEPFDGPKAVSISIEDADKIDPEKIKETYGRLKMPDLRKRCKEMGLKQSPRDTKDSLLEKICGHAA